MSSAEDLSYHHVSSGLNNQNGSISSQNNVNVNQNVQTNGLKRKKGRKPKGLGGDPSNGSFGSNGGSNGGSGGSGKRKSRES